MDRRVTPISINVAAFCRIFSEVVLASKSVYARGQTRQFPRNCVFVEHSLSDRPVQLRLGQLKGGLGRLLVAGFDCYFDLFDKSSNSASPSAIDRRALGGLANALFRRFVSGHAARR